MIRRRTIRIAGLCAAGLLVLALVGLAAASPGGDAQVETSGFELVFNNDGGVSADCPHNSVAVGGGLGFYGVPGDANVAINVSGPTNSSELTSHTETGDFARNWYASSYSGEGSDVSFKTFAICSRSSKARLRVKKFKAGPGKVGSATVSCPRGQRALGGGLGITDGPASGVYEVSSGPLARTGGVAAVKTGSVARRWRVTAYNGYGTTRTFKALVGCARSGNARIVSDRVDVTPNSTTEAVAACPTGKRALGGGIDLIGSSTSQLQMLANGPQGSTGQTETTKDGDTAVYWDGAFYNRTSETRNFKVLAICASN